MAEDGARGQEGQLRSLPALSMPVWTVCAGQLTRCWRDTKMDMTPRGTLGEGPVLHKPTP